MSATKTRPPKVEPRHLQLTKALQKVPEPATPSAKDAERPDRSRWAVWAALILLAVVVGGIGYVVWRGQSAEDETAGLLRLIDTECGPGGTDPSAPLCVLTAPQRADETVAAATATGVDAAQVIELVRAELDQRGVTGQTVSTDEIAGIVRSVLAANPDLYRGEQGLPGDPGDPAPPPSDEQVQAAAAAVFAANPELYRGADGKEGPQGVGVQDLDFAERGGECVAVVLLVDPATGATRELTTPVAETVCSSTAPTPVDPDPTVEPDPDPVPDAPTPQPEDTTEPTPPGGLFG